MKNLKVEYRPLDGLIPYANNARTHSDEQIAEIGRCQASCHVKVLN